MSKFTEAMEGRTAAEGPVVMTEMWIDALSVEMRRLAAEHELLELSVEERLNDDDHEGCVSAGQLQLCNAMAQNNGVMIGISRATEIFSELFEP